MAEKLTAVAVSIKLPKDVYEILCHRVLYGKHRSVRDYISERIIYDTRRKHRRTRGVKGNG